MNDSKNNRAFFIGAKEFAWCAGNVKKKKEINKKGKDKSSNKSAYERINNIENEYY